MDRRGDLDRFYDLMADLEVRCEGRRQLAQSDGRMSWPRRGVYFFFETGEVREDGVTPRLVRVGTHALRPSDSTLWGRLSQHRGSLAGRYAGGGNHRGSVFRLHVGTALLETEEWPDSIRRTWGVGSSTDPETRMNEHALEKAVSDWIGRMPFLWVDIDDPPGPSTDRGVVERGAIALVSNHTGPPIDRPSLNWLGRVASAEAIRLSGLWNVNHVLESVDDRFLTLLETHVSSM